MASSNTRRRPGLPTGEVFGGGYKVVQLIGEGGYGSVYDVQKIPTEERYALKVQWLTPRSLDADVMAGEDKDQWRLKMDVQVLRALRDSGFAKAHCKYVEWGFSEQLSYTVTALGGPDLHAVKKRSPQRRFSLRSAIFLAERALESIHELHRIGYIHRDVKPQNFVVGRQGDLRSVYMVDMGLARRWVLKKGVGIDYDEVAEPKIRPPRMQAGFRGTLRYASLATHREHDVGRVDDLWQWFFMIVEFTVDWLPWDRDICMTGLSMLERMKRVKDIKQRTVHSSTTILEGCPHEFAQICNRLKPLKYFDRPDYESLAAVLRSINVRKGYNDTVPLDWEPKAENLNVMPHEKTVMTSIAGKTNPKQPPKKSAGP